LPPPPGLDVCIHAAWYLGTDYLASPENVALLGASADLVSRVVQAGYRRFVGIGTCFEYDTRLGYLSEDSPTAPRHLYSSCKLALAEIAGKLCAGAGVSFAWARPFYVYGPTESPSRLVPRICRALRSGERARLSSGEQVRDYMHVEDLASAIVKVAMGDVEGAVNVASGVPVTIRALVETIAELCDRRDLLALGAEPARPDDPPFVCANVTKLRARTGFTPRFDVRSGLAHTLQTFGSTEQP
jgi:nucleoside-diphosphate-sugar epimerase